MVYPQGMDKSCLYKSSHNGDSTPLLDPDGIRLLGPSLQVSTPGEGGYRRLEVGPAERHAVRTDLGGVRPSGRLRGLVALAQVSDLHVTDAQSPGRAEYLDRLGDDDSEVAALVGPMGTYRPQESLTHHVVEAMTQRLRRIDTGPVTGVAVSFAVSTGDAADNAQGNEIEAAVGLLDGGARIVPDSGDLSRWEGVGGHQAYDHRFWHPDGPPTGEAPDRPHLRYGFPTVPGLLDAARRPFRSGGLGVPWHPVYGNHDCHLSGTLPVTPGLRRVTEGWRKGTGWPPGMDAHDLQRMLGDSERRPPEVLRPLLGAAWRPVRRDAARGQLDAPGWADRHHGRSARPAGAPTWYGFDAGPVRGLVLDTVNHEGGWQGSIGATQLEWLERELRAGSSRWLDADGRECRSGRTDRLFILFSHHPLRCLTNAWAPSGEHRATSGEVEDLLARFPGVVAWVNGHTHTNTITAHRSHAALGGGWWEVTTASHVDWPQQARIIELARDLDNDGLVIACTVVDHDGIVDPRRGGLDEITTLAGWSREVAANHWQHPDGATSGARRGQGRPEDRNVLLVSPVAVPALLEVGA
jgi:metallophosphoesterase (TIGR03767 family)